MKRLLFLFLVTYLTGCRDRHSIIVTGLEGRALPSFNLLLMDSATTINTNQIPTGKPIVLLFINPYCPFCRAETQQIIDHLNSLNNIKFLVFSIFPFGSIKEYYNHFKLNKYTNIVVGQDYTDYFGKYFKIPGVPYMAIYAKDKRLRQVLIGNIGTNRIKDIAME